MSRRGEEGVAVELFGNVGDRGEVSFLGDELSTTLSSEPVASEEWSVGLVEKDRCCCRIFGVSQNRASAVHVNTYRL